MARAGEARVDELSRVQRHAALAPISSLCALSRGRPVPSLPIRRFYYQANKQCEQGHLVDPRRCMRSIVKGASAAEWSAGRRGCLVLASARRAYEAALRFGRSSATVEEGATPPRGFVGSGSRSRTGLAGALSQSTSRILRRAVGHVTSGEFLRGRGVRLKPDSTGERAYVRIRR